MGRKRRLLQGAAAETGKYMAGEELGSAAQFIAVPVCSTWPLTLRYAVPHSAPFLRL